VRGVRLFFDVDGAKLVGHGRSDAPPPERLTLDEWADDVAALGDVLGVEAPVRFLDGLEERVPA